MPGPAMLIDAAQLHARMSTEPVVVLDGRDPKAFAQGHIPGAVNLREMLTYLPLRSDEAGRQALQETFSRLFGLAGLSGEELAVVCEDALDGAFGSSCRGYLLLRHLGYPRVCLLDGGYRGWVAQGLPVTQALFTPAPQVFPLQIEDGWMASREDVLRAIVSGNATLVDARDEAEWVGESSSPIGRDYCPRKGRIPGARWLPWREMFRDADGIARFQNPGAIRARCEALGIAADTPVIVYCFAGVRAAAVVLGLRAAGLRDVRNYFAAWNEWSRDFALPIEEGPPRGMR